MTSDNVTSVGIMSDSELWQTSGSGTSACDARVHFRAHEYVAMDTGVAANDGMTENKQSDQDGKDTENPDERMVKRDPVRGYVLHMQLLPRLRYLLEVAAVPGLVEPILDILLAVGSHTPVMARQIVQCSRLVEYIHGEFVRVDRPADTGSKRLPYGTPHVKALRLMTVLAASSSDVCEHLHQEGVYSSMLRYAMYPFGEPTDEEDEHGV
ncbi:hypothetical protein, variant [Sphaeroforma arctica JP610]|uniref:Uncharacterized protein n=1 Tax=Sphaeroforma arctica JP610 TaxID=667725 RepID=A0A0L0FA18_9EUKA|nr:hypothetical protein, variant [Sphaeroforma arctica JP610]KNC73391.1 hypothetical protein, variant [Sphaeroforma arctica JP610]|eukprot:XP_014147293.1 hypothetical protein, variant [Sphaeroforma arctica JP610]